MYYSSSLDKHCHKIAGISSSDHGQTAKPLGVSTDKLAQQKILLKKQVVINLNMWLSMYRLSQQAKTDVTEVWAIAH